MAILDVQPNNKVQVLVFPKSCYPLLQHVPAALGQELFTLLTKVEKALWSTEGMACEGTTLLLHNGEKAGQRIPHLHFHLIPRFANDHFKIKYQAKRPTRQALEALSERIRATVDL